MKRIFAVFALVLLLLAGCGKEPDTIQFHEWTLDKADLSQETIEWLEWYNTLSEEGQMSVSFIPGDVRELCGLVGGFASETEGPSE